jgi:hypothetical protein
MLESIGKSFGKHWEQAAQWRNILGRDNYHTIKWRYSQFTLCQIGSNLGRAIQEKPDQKSGETGALTAGIVFHYFHDAFLYFVQLPDGDYTGITENLVFYACLWLMVAIGMLITRWAVKKPELCTPRAMNCLARI